MNRLTLALVVCLLTSPAWAMEKWQGWCEQGGVKVSMPTLGVSTSKFMQSFPGCTITVYDSGTSNLSTIYSDDGVTQKFNPFTSDSTTGLAFFYAANGLYDVKFSGGGITAPFTLSAWLLNDPTNVTTINVATFNHTFWADHFTGATSADRINNAMAACTAYNKNTAGIGCLVVMEPTMAAGEGNQAPDNVMLWDLRGSAQSQGFRFNVGTAATSIRSKVLLQDNYDLVTIGADSGGHGATSLYVLGYPDKANRSANTVAGGNVSVSTNTIDGSMTVPLVGFEAEAFARPAVGGGFTIADSRALTANVDCTPSSGSLTCTRLVSGYFQAPTKGTGATVGNAYSAYFENPSLAVTGEALSILSQGDVRLAQHIAVGSASAFSASVGLFVFDPVNLSGVNQFGIQSSVQTTSAATSSGAAFVGRADVAAATTQTFNYGWYVQTPLKGAGAAITNWQGMHIEKAPTVGNSAHSIALDGSTSGTAFLDPPATGGVASVLPSVAGVLAQITNAQTFGGLQTFSGGISATSLTTAGQITSTIATGAAPFIVASTTPVANLTTSPLAYNISGTQQTGVHFVYGHCTLGTSCAVTLTGSAIFTGTTSYECSATDETSAAATKFAPASGSSFALTGTGTDVLSWHCVGN